MYLGLVLTKLAIIEYQKKNQKNICMSSIRRCNSNAIQKNACSFNTVIPPMQSRRMLIICRFFNAVIPTMQSRRMLIICRSFYPEACLSSDTLSPSMQIYCYHPNLNFDNMKPPYVGMSIICSFFYPEACLSSDALSLSMQIYYCHPNLELWQHESSIHRYVYLLFFLHHKHIALIPISSFDNMEASYVCMASYVCRGYQLCIDDIGLLNVIGSLLLQRTIRSLPLQRTRNTDEDENTGRCSWIGQQTQDRQGLIAYHRFVSHW